MPQSSLRDVLIIEGDIAMQGGLQIRRGVKAMGLQHVFNPPVEAFHHPIGLRPAGWDQAVFDGLFGTELVEFVIARGLFGAGQEAVGKFRTVIGEALLDAERRGLDHGFQEDPGAVGGAIGFEGDIDPAGGPVDGDEQVATRLAPDRREAFNIDLEETGFIRLERLTGVGSGVGSRALREATP